MFFFSLLFSDTSLLLRKQHVSRPIHAVLYFLLFLQQTSIPLSKCPNIALSTHPLMDTWAASISWQL